MSEAERLSLRHPGGTTTIYIGNEILEPARGQVSKWVEGRRVFLLTSPTVRRLHEESIRPLLETASHLEVLEVPDGEAAKNLDVAGGLWRKMLAAGGKRDSRLVTLGGGSVGDLGGFVAGCFLRGIEYLQFPTTLLAQVDAAIGGKTAIDLEGAKNSVGLFHHPAMVVSEIRFLETLPPEEIRAALAEVVKMALLLDRLLLEQVERQLPALLAGDLKALEPVVLAAAKAKVRVVERDPSEGDQRRLLNFGHTLGHAIESVLNYKGLRHGEAVAYGMLFALRLAKREGLEEGVARRLSELLRQFQLPPLPALEVKALMKAMGKDKKAKEQGLVWVLPLAVGAGKMIPGILPQVVRAELKAFLEDPWTLPAGA
jgi:3-dehydroquinate synthase